MMGLIQKIPSDITDWGILLELRQILKRVAPEVDTAKVIKDKFIADDLDIDDLGVVELVVEIEDQFGIKITDEETMYLIRLGSIADAIRIISEHISQ